MDATDGGAGNFTIANCASPFVAPREDGSGALSLTKIILTL